MDFIPEWITSFVLWTTLALVVIPVLVFIYARIGAYCAIKMWHDLERRRALTENRRG